MLLRPLRRRVGVSDVAQNVHLKITKALPQARGETVTALRGWIARITIQEVSWQARQSRRSRTYEASTLSPDHSGPAVLASSAEFQGAFSDALRRLSPAQKSLLDLYYSGEHTYDSIARQFGVSPSTAERRVKEAETRLRELVRALL